MPSTTQKHISHCLVQWKWSVAAAKAKVVCVEAEEHCSSEMILPNPVCLGSGAALVLVADPVVAIEGVGHLCMMIHLLSER